MVLTYAMGFKTCMANGDHDNVTNANYGNVGFGLIVDTRMAPLMRLRVWGSPSLGLGSTNDLVIFLGPLMVWSMLCIVDGDDTLFNEGMLHWFHDRILCLSRCFKHFILLILILLGVCR